MAKKAESKKHDFHLLYVTVVEGKYYIIGNSNGNCIYIDNQGNEVAAPGELNFNNCFDSIEAAADYCEKNKSIPE